MFRNKLKIYKLFRRKITLNVWGLQSFNLIIYSSPTKYKIFKLRNHEIMRYFFKDFPTILFTSKKT